MMRRGFTSPPAKYDSGARSPPAPRRAPTATTSARQGRHLQPARDGGRRSPRCSNTSRRAHRPDGDRDHRPDTIAGAEVARQLAEGGLPVRSSSGRSATRETTVGLFLDTAVPPGLSAAATIAAIHREAGSPSPHPFFNDRPRLPPEKMDSVRQVLASPAGRRGGGGQQHPFLELANRRARRFAARHELARARRVGRAYRPRRRQGFTRFTAAARRICAARSSPAQSRPAPRATRRPTSSPTCASGWTTASARRSRCRGRAARNWRSAPSAPRRRSRPKPTPHRTPPLTGRLPTAQALRAGVGSSILALPPSSLRCPQEPAYSTPGPSEQPQRRCASRR